MFLWMGMSIYFDGCDKEIEHFFGVESKSTECVFARVLEENILVSSYAWLQYLGRLFAFITIASTL